MSKSSYVLLALKLQIILSDKYVFGSGNSVSSSDNCFEFQNRKLHYAALFCCACNSTSFYLADLIFLFFRFSGIVFPKERNKRHNFPGDSSESSSLAAKEKEENTKKIRSFSSIIKVPLQKICLNAENHM